MAAQKKRTRRKQPPKYSKIAVTALLATVAAFTVCMIVVYIIKGSVPDTLIVSFFAFAGGEAGCMGLIKYSDNKYTGTPGDGPQGGGAGAG